MAALDSVPEANWALSSARRQQREGSPKHVGRDQLMKCQIQENTMTESPGIKCHMKRTTKNSLHLLTTFSLMFEDSLEIEFRQASGGSSKLAICSGGPGPAPSLD